MIRLPKINIEDTELQLTIASILVFLFLMYRFDIKILVGMIVLFLFINHYTEFQGKLNKALFSKGKEKHYNHTVEKLFKRLRRYKKYNPKDYSQGINYWKKFTKYLDYLINDQLIHYNHYFDKSQYYYDHSLKSFHSIVASMNDKELMKIVYSDDNHTLDDLSSIINELQKEGNDLLYNLSLRLNKQWEKDPHVVNKEIIYGHPHPVNTINDKYNQNEYV